MQLGSNGTVSLTFKECFGFGCAAVTTLGVCVACIWNIFAYTNERFDKLSERDDVLHRETRALVEKVIDGEIDDLTVTIGDQIEDLKTVVNKTQTIFLERDELFRQQVQQTTKNEIELKNVIQDLEDGQYEKQTIKRELDSLRQEITSLRFTFQGSGSMDPSSIQPSAPPVSTTIRPAANPRR